MDTQQWSHATNSLQSVKIALQDPNITAIECDVILGTVKVEGNEDDSSNRIPVLSHPPKYDSDISLETLIQLISETTQDEEEKSQLRKHLKLDFKDLDAVQPTLAILQDSNIANPWQKTITLNADILCGPGRRFGKPVSPEMFLESCLNHIQSCKVCDVSIP